jgi:CDGSH-type Zn-finger protein
VAERPAEPAQGGPTSVPSFLASVAGGVTLDPGGPVLVEGPVDLVLPDGTPVRSSRPVVAVCACRRSKHYPFCDTSHRERARSAEAPATPGPAGNGSRSED